MTDIRANFNIDKELWEEFKKMVDDSPLYKTRSEALRAFINSWVTRRREMFGRGRD